MSQKKNPNVVTDDDRVKLSDLWKIEDYWAIWLGFALLIVGYFLFIANAPMEKFAQEIDKANQTIAAASQKANFKTIEYYEAQDAKKKLRSRESKEGKAIAEFLTTPARWKDNPLDAFYTSEKGAKVANDKARSKAIEAKSKLDNTLDVAAAAQKAAEGAEYKDAGLNAEAEAKIADWRKAADASSKAKTAATVTASNIFPSLAGLMLACIFFFGIGVIFMGGNFFKFAIGFIGVFIVAVIAFMMGSQNDMRTYGIGVEVWSIIIGMLIANTVGTPKFIMPAVQTEYYIKTGLVLLGAEILLDKIVAIGTPGVFVAWVVTPIVLVCTYIFGQKVLKMPSKTLNIVICADMSVCGTSAAIATASACRAKKEELTLSIGISLVFTAIMMVTMPPFIKAVGMPPILGGAWIGGTIDATGAVAAAGAALGPEGLYTAATVKMIQNILIGVVAFCVALYWTAKVEPSEKGMAGRKVGLGEIWNRFPKFVLGFLTVSIVASLISSGVGPDMSNAVVSEGLVRGIATPMRNWCFALAFVSIGLGTNFRELGHYLKGGKPVILYVCGQGLNLLLTFAMAYLMFYVVFPEITAKI
jgi:Predicted membrane protein